MTQAILLPVRGEYPQKSFKAVAATAWSKFFEVADLESDLALWEIEADSATVKVTGRRIDADESNPAWAPPTPVVAIVDGIIEAFNSQPKSTYPHLRESFQMWVTEGIIEAFHSPRVTQKFSKWLGKQQSFGIVTTPNDDELSNSDLSLLWTNDKNLTLTSIASRQATAKKRTPKRTHAIRKKPITKKVRGKK